MTVIEGQIQPLKKLKETLEENGITRFGSIAEINDFIKNYEAEKNAIPTLIMNEFDAEISQLHIDLSQHQQDYDKLKIEVTNETNLKINKLKEALKLSTDKSKKNLVHKLFYYPKTKILKNKKTSLENNFENIVSKKTNVVQKEVSRVKQKLDDYTSNREVYISERSLRSAQELENIKEVIDSLYNVIAGAIGESSVIKEIQKLSDNFHLFNDFSAEFNPPIYYKKEDDRIYTIQIDHLLVSEAGVFIIETKNWGEQSVKNIDLRSPVKQIMRSSYALFVLLNSQSRHNIDLENHHWGSKQIPVRNLIVMTGAKPKEEFKHVKVLSLRDLNSYVSYFDPIFNSAEIESICDYLRTRMSDEI